VAAPGNFKLHKIGILGFHSHESRGTQDVVLMTQYFDPLVERFIAALREALPHCPLREIYWGYQFLTGALTITFAESSRIDKLSGGLCKSSDLDSVHERLPPYIAAGFRAICGLSAPTSRLKKTHPSAAYSIRKRQPKKSP